MAYPLHQPIQISTGLKSGAPNRRDGVFIDVAKDRADILIVDERQPYDAATQIATDSEAAEPWPFNPAATKWKLKRAVRAKSAQEAAEYQNELSRQQIAGGLLLLAQVTITLIDKLLQKGTIAAGDFDAPTRAMYQTLKAHVDRLR